MHPEREEKIKNDIGYNLDDATDRGYQVILKRSEYNRALFCQLIMDNVAYLSTKAENITNSELGFLFKLSSFVERYSNALIKIEKRTSYGYKFQKRYATVSWIAEFLNYSSRSYVSKLINSLIKKGIILEDPEVDNSNTSRVLYINPEILYRGNKNRVTKKLCNILQDKDPLEEQGIKLPWKLWIHPNKRSGKLYKRNSYNRFKREQERKKKLLKNYFLMVKIYNNY